MNYRYNALNNVPKDEITSWDILKRMLVVDETIQDEPRTGVSIRWPRGSQPSYTSPRIPELTEGGRVYSPTLSQSRGCWDLKRNLAIEKLEILEPIARCRMQARHG